MPRPIKGKTYESDEDESSSQSASSSTFSSASAKKRKSNKTQKKKSVKLVECIEVEKPQVEKAIKMFKEAFADHLEESADIEHAYDAVHLFREIFSAVVEHDKKFAESLGYLEDVLADVQDGVEEDDFDWSKIDEYVRKLTSAIKHIVKDRWKGAYVPASGSLGKIVKRLRQ